MRFIKMNGLGNDYIFFDKRKNIEIPNEKDIPSLCDRNFGIGGDGVVIMEKSSDCTLKMIIYNADGSRAELCGNALRCVARYEFDRQRRKNKAIFRIETDAGKKVIEVDKNSIIADMGKPDIQQELQFRDTQIRGTVVNVGNPHFVVFCDSTDEMNDSFVRYAEAISNDTEYFSKRTNVEFACIVPQKNRLTMRVYERGSGETLACGTGATAVFALAYQNAFINDNAVIALRGGELCFTHNTCGNILLCGDAQYNYKGKI